MSGAFGVGTAGGSIGRLADGAQPRSLDDLLRDRVRAEHDRAAEDLARRRHERRHGAPGPRRRPAPSLDPRPAAAARIRRAARRAAARRARRRRSRRCSTATTAACSASAGTCSARSRRPRTRCSTRSWPPIAGSRSRSKPIHLRPWLYTIARNRCLTTLRARARQATGELQEPPTEHLASEVERRHDLRTLLGDVSRLPDDQRAALVLSELGDMTHEEIAEVLGCRREKVKALVFQARSSLVASRSARETSCGEIRAQLANADGRLAAAQRGAPAPIRVRGLPRLPRPAAAPAPRPRSRAAGGADRRSQGRRRRRGHSVRRNRDEGARRRRDRRHRDRGRRGRPLAQDPVARAAGRPA